jgi:hypothetical protein
MNANAPEDSQNIEDETISTEEEAAVARSKASFDSNDGIPWEERLASLGVSIDEITQASRTLIPE